MTIRVGSSGLVTLIFALALVLAASAAAETVDYETWLNGVIREAAEPLAGEAVKTAVENTAESKSVLTSSTANNATSLVDTSSVSDLVGIGLNLAGLSGSTEGGDDANSVSATVSGYAFYSAFKGIQPLDPTEYCTASARLSRAFSATLGYDDDEDADDSDKSGRVILAGARVSLWPGVIEGADACTRDTSEISRALIDATRAAASLSHASQNKLIDLAGVDGSDPAQMAAFINSLGDPANLDSIMDRHGAAFKEWLADEYFTEERIAPFRNLDAAEKKLIGGLQEGQRWSVDLLTKQRSGSGADEYRASMIWDWTASEHLSFTGNGAFNYEDIGSRSDSVGATLAAAIRYAPILSREVWGRSPIKTELSFSGKWMSRQEDTYKGQLAIRLALPWGPTKGIELPISLTVANRTELVDETDVRGVVGFSFDTSQLFGALDPIAMFLRR